MVNELLIPLSFLNHAESCRLTRWFSQITLYQLIHLSAKLSDIHSGNLR